MFILYNILQLGLLVVFFPLILLFVLFSNKYRNRIPARLGFGLQKTISINTKHQQTIWLHALSVGEITSAFPLLTGLRQKYPESKIIVSVSTRTGKTLANDMLSNLADHVIDGPLDFLPTISHFINCIQPDLYLQVETDFWPNILNQLKRKKIPAILVNGRISENSMAQYSKYDFFFRPIFNSFTYLCLQTKLDKQNMLKLRVPNEKLMTLGNLKFDAIPKKPKKTEQHFKQFIPKGTIILIAGSTHDGEELLLLKGYKSIRDRYPELFLILVPRNPGRADEILVMAENIGLQSSLRSKDLKEDTDLLLVDSIGELTDFYSLSDIAFVGGSLVNAGGHNPIEPASLSLPVLFGPNMQDFTEIANDLMATGGAKQITNQVDLERVLETLLVSSQDRIVQGELAYQCVQRQRGVVDRHLELIQGLL